MNNRQIETSREIRLWITGIIGPVVTGTAIILANNPELQTVAWKKIKEKARQVSNKLKRVKEA